MRLRNIERDGFAPLREWVRYVVHEHAAVIHTWSRGFGPLLTPMREAQPTQVPTIDPPVNEDKASEGSEDIPIKSTEGEQNEPGSVQIKAPSSSPLTTRT